ncbi:hypothetical protein AS188_04730 [Kocuria flava]|uniref:Uncharacterized protein n=1 Tax=Kocuria flava TaxID=446860 RepID=A0A0U3HED5_9MICC|nr:hypothetical protein AS188_04730 [Kocuria flava]
MRAGQARARRRTRTVAAAASRRPPAPATRSGVPEDRASAAVWTSKPGLTASGCGRGLLDRGGDHRRGLDRGGGGHGCFHGRGGGGHGCFHGRGGRHRGRCSRDGRGRGGPAGQRGLLEQPRQLRGRGLVDPQLGEQAVEDHGGLGHRLLRGGGVHALERGAQPGVELGQARLGGRDGRRVPGLLGQRQLLGGLLQLLQARPAGAADQGGVPGLGGGDGLGGELHLGQGLRGDAGAGHGRLEGGGGLGAGGRARGGRGRGAARDEAPGQQGGRGGGGGPAACRAAGGAWLGGGSRHRVRISDRRALRALPAGAVPARGRAGLLRAEGTGPSRVVPGACAGPWSCLEPGRDRRTAAGLKLRTRRFR